MFLRRHRCTHGSKTYGYWWLMRTVRTAKGPRHQLEAYWGKPPWVDEDHRRGWEDIADLLEGRDAPRPVQGRLGQTPSCEPSPCQWMQVDVRGLRVERVRDFGEVYLALAL